MPKAKNKWISGLALVMSAALIGLTLVQSFWIRSAYRSQELLFSLSVATSQRLITEDVRAFEWLIVRSEADSPFPYRPNSVRRISTEELDSIILLARSSVRSRSDSVRSGVNDIQGASPSQSITRVAPGPDGAYQEEGPTNLLDAARAEVPLTERIDKFSLEYFIQSELHRSGIDTPYEYAVLDENGSPVYRSADYRQDAASFHKFSSPLFYGSPYELSMYFPDYKNSLFRSVWLITAISVVLMVVLIAMFVVSIYTIVHQKKLSEMRTDFMNNVTHELKTPISTISLASQMLADSSIPDSSKDLGRLAAVISHESKRLGNQVEKVLQMAIFENGKMNLRWKTINVNQLLESVVENVALQVIDRKGSIDLFLDAERSEVQADEIHFTNVLFNLIDNAIKYSKGAPCIQITTSNVGEELLISVKDEGIGIPKSDQKRIFDQFYRVHTGNVHNVKGFGLGLSYVHRMVAAHKGRIVLESEVDEGTTFHIYVPLSGAE